MAHTNFKADVFLYKYILYNVNELSNNKALGEKENSPDIILSEAPSLVNTLSIGVSLHTSAGM